MKKVLFVLLLCFLISTVSFGQEGTGSGGGTGTITRLTTFSVSFMSGIAFAANISGITLSDYGPNGSPADYDIADFFTVSELTTNYNTTVSAYTSGWTVPAGYPTSGPKHPTQLSATASGLRLIVDPGTTFGDLTNSMATATELGTTGKDAVVSGDVQGVWQNDFAGDIQFDLEAGVDVAGSYSTDVTLEVWETTEAP